MKHQLLIDKFQTPIQAHFDWWLQVIQLVEWLLLLASDELAPQPKKGQKSADAKRIQPLNPPIQGIPTEAANRDSMLPEPKRNPNRILENTIQAGTRIPETDSVLKIQPVEPPAFEKEPPRLSLPKTRKAAQTLFGTFDQTKLLPQTSNKGKGRKLGTRFPTKPTFKTVKKNTKNTKKKHGESNSTPKLAKKQPNSS